MTTQRLFLGVVLAAVLGGVSGCGGGGGSDGACELKAHAGEAAMIAVTNRLDHTIGWRIDGDPAFSQQAPGECARMGVPAGPYAITVTDCANPACNFPNLAERQVTGTVAAGETVAIEVAAGFF